MGVKTRVQNCNICNFIKYTLLGMTLAYCILMCYFCVILFIVITSRGSYCSIRAFEVLFVDLHILVSVWSNFCVLIICTYMLHDNHTILWCPSPQPRCNSCLKMPLWCLLVHTTVYWREFQERVLFSPISTKCHLI